MIEDNNLDQCRYLYNMASLNEYERYVIANKHGLLSGDKATKKPLELTKFTVTIDQKLFEEMMEKIELQGIADNLYHADNSIRYEILANGF
jgi:hypothetical protein